MRHAGVLPALRAPARGGCRGGTQDPVGEVVDESGLLGHVDELLRRGDAAVGLAPAQQRFDLGRLEGVQRHLRLVHQQQLAALNRAAQRLLEPEALRRGVVERRAVERVAVAPQLLGAKQRYVRGAQQALGVRGMVRVEAGADTGAGGEHATVDRSAAAAAWRRAGRHALDLLGGFDVLEQHRELIAAEPRQQPGAAAWRRAGAAAMCCSTRSPKLWPRVSLIDLKLSTSTNSSARRCAGPARASAASRCAESLRRLGSCVSGSWCARWCSCWVRSAT